MKKTKVILNFDQTVKILNEKNTNLLQKYWENT